MKLVKNSDITLTVDGNGVPIFFEPVKSQQNVLCIESHKLSDLRTVEVLLPSFFWDTLWRSTSKVRRSLRSLSGESIPEEIGEEHLNGPKVTEFVAFNAKHILLGLCWFKENGHTVTINSERYIAILDQFHGDLTQKLTQGQLRLAWFIQDGARPHTAHASLKHLRGFFKNRLISLNTDHEWAPHSPNLIPLDL